MDTNSIFTAALIYLGMVTVAFWLAMIFWTFRDMRGRSRDVLAAVLVTVLVAILFVPGLLIYLFLRPRETLSEAYERSLEEEALLQEIEEKPACPGCKQRVQEDWQACPNCHTRLKKGCVRCGKMLDLAWDLCPYCAAGQPGSSIERGMIGVTVNAASGHARPASEGWTVEMPDNAPRRARGGRRERTERGETLEFVDNDDGG